MSSTGHAAMKAWSHGRRRRSVAASVERLADAIMATGGVLLVNAMFGLGMGFPEGSAGIALGSALLFASLGWISRHRAHERIARAAARIETLTFSHPQQRPLPARRAA